MTYNIHPIFVHFPIAFLFVYALIKIVPIRKWLPSVAWNQIERILLVVGVLGAFVANSTGEIAENLTNPNREILNMHTTFASISIWIFTLLLLGEVLVFVIPFVASKLNIAWITNILVQIKQILTNRFLVAVLAVCGFVAISITGLLGGVMVYGTSADPVAGIVLKILGISF